MAACFAPSAFVHPLHWKHGLLLQISFSSPFIFPLWLFVSTSTTSTETTLLDAIFSVENIWRLHSKNTISRAFYRFTYSRLWINPMLLRLSFNLVLELNVYRAALSIIFTKLDQLISCFWDVYIFRFNRLFALSNISHWSTIF